MTSAQLRVRTISADEHLAHITSRSSVSFLQTPAWARVKAEWRGESIGWFESGSAGESRIVGAALVLYRQVPKIQRYLAYLPEGPAIDWADPDLSRWLSPLAAHLKQQKAFGIRIGPPVVTRRWHADTVKRAIADDALPSLRRTPADVTDPQNIAVTERLSSLGWKPLATEGGFAAGQPQYNFWVPLSHADGSPKSEDEVLAGMNQLWRRNIRKAAKAGVETSHGTRDDLADFHRIYTETAERDHFTPRPLSYFRTMWDALNGEDPDRMSLHLAHHEGDLVAATTLVRVGTHAWYSYGASTTAKRDVRGSNAVQWQMIRDALAAGADVYDMRGITDTLDPDDPHVGLIQFKAGTGGDAVEYVGEWDLPLNRPLHAAFTAYMRRRG
ncbi:lipid II:glycine glycyltransferase FemX [Aeromicrobium sp. CTD01-1L150]|uniref:lipid II:glycine glycyltransferase FemX n=1 Tax=Aeromicrobium sp. CTD01-1L150 TaxID=3341830 RepID=UPI0035C22797